MTDINLFDVVYIELNGKGSEQCGIRPCVVIQNDIGNKYGSTVVVIPFTTKIKKVNQPTHCIIYTDSYNGLTRTSMCLAENVTVVSKERIMRKVGFIYGKEMQDKIIDCYIANITGRKNNLDRRVSC